MAWFILETNPATAALKEAGREARAAKAATLGEDAQFGTFYVEKGDTALFSFQSFKTDAQGWEGFYAGKGELPVGTDSYAALLDAIRKAEKNPDIKNFVIDVSTNSGGGPCAAEYCATADGWRFTISSNTRVTSDTWESIDAGVPVDVELVKVAADGTRDYSGLYDLDAVSAALMSYRESAPQ